ncbi:hypothetical protein B0T16DRAFT_352709 [Cercophora newfieldiana]|uniref:TM7S3/TM198-like domain-containing protein n=1 Tax=Cercophora newfieldiana TaxID=92897 RepID=A0AA39Y628_9PEZI|nr:hypothetical protein B0T16DRAFT_352709 [Cercophora newfieldiana]
MRVLQSSGVGFLLRLCLFSNIVLATALVPLRRQDTDSPTTNTRDPTPTPGEGETVASLVATGTQSSGTASSTDVSSVTHSSTSSFFPSPTSNSDLNSTLLSHSVPDGELPLQPQITPGWAVAGVILLGTGIVYALVGIKAKWLHTFFSTAFLTSLGTTVLIVYVIIPPVGNPIQGAYVVAAVCTGAILGGLAIVFKEITECLGCLLGGFCLSMWLLALQPGGLIPTTGGKVGFIAAFTLAGFCLYFTKWTRTYGLIVCISFSGATVAVLGIDCFSRAGLKEFWAYLWALNDNLFPLGAVTYPLTRGIRVELAVTILIFLAGIVSQLKLWRIIKERRDKKNAEIAEGERNLRVEEENVGRQVEEMTSRERREWERVYGDSSTSQLADSDDSGVGDMGMGSEKRRVRSSKSVSASVTITTRAQSPTGTEQLDAARADSPVGRAATPLSLAKALAAAEAAMSKEKGDSRVVVRIAEDDIADGSGGGVETPVEGDRDGDTIGTPSAMSTSRRGSQPLSSQVLPVVPLPFKIPEARDDEERSSVATFADEDEDEDEEERPRAPVRVSQNRAEGLARRLSSGPAKLLRNLSQRSARSKTAEQQQVASASESREVLVEAVRYTREDTDSVLANMDDLSSPGGGTSSIRDSVAFSKIELDLELSSGGGETQSLPLGHTTDSSGGVPVKTSLPSLVLPGAIELEDLDLSRQVQVASTGEEAEDITSAKEGGSGSGRRKSTASVDSVAASLTRGNLPAALSRVALSYRTNEWAKHLSVAEIPEPDSPQLPEHERSLALGSPVPSEEPAPVDVVELQQTAENAAPPLAAPRTASAMSNYALQQAAVSRSSSRGSLSGYPDALTPEPPQIQLRNRTAVPYRSMSGTLKVRTSALFAQPIAEEGDGDSTSTSNPLAMARPMSASPTPQELSAAAAATTPYSSPHTLIGMRETILRNKASYSYLIPPSAADILPTIPSSGPPSDAGSLHNYPGAIASIDLDDLPLSQRRAMIRQNSTATFTTKPSRSSLRSLTNPNPAPTPTAETTGFDSHQPLRSSIAPSEAIRQAQLANFRSSVVADLRPTSGLVAHAVNVGGPAFGGQPQLAGSPSMASLRSAYGDVLLAQRAKEAEERREREMEERMRSGVMMEAHRDALRKMQSRVNMKDL